MDNFYGVTDPPLQTVSPGAHITYRVRYHRPWLGGPDPYYEWYWYDERDVRKDDNKVQVHQMYMGQYDTKFWEREKTWDDLGRYTVVCTVHHGGETQDIVFHTDVQPVETLLTPELNAAKSAGVIDIWATLLIVLRYVRTLKAVAAKYPPASPKAKREHEALLEHYDKYIHHMGDLQSESQGGTRYTINAVHIDKASQRKSRLNIFIARRPSTGEWVLVDWTNPVDRAYTGVYTAKGVTGDEAIANLIEAWKDNRYPAGAVRCFIPSPPRSSETVLQFDTDGERLLDTAAKWLERIALAASVIAGVVTLIAPVPGSQVVSAMIWTAIFSSSAAAIINIGQRHAEGFGNAKDDAFDALTIVANCFAGTGTWAKGATVLAKNAQGQVVKAVLIGQVATDGVQGVLVAVDTAQQYDEIMNNSSLTPEERTGRLVELFKGAAIAATMTYISMKGTVEDINHMNVADRHGNTPGSKLKELGQPGKEVNLTGEPVVETHTNKGENTTTTKDQHHQKEMENDLSASKIKPRIRGKMQRTYKKAGPPEKRGLRPRDHEVLLAKAQEKEVYIFVRDGNEDSVARMGKDYTTPTGKTYPTTSKGEDMKAKTSKTDPTKGLVTFPNSTDERFRTLDSLAGEPPPMTKAELKANQAEFDKRYKHFLDEKITGHNFTVLGENDGWLVIDAQGRAIHGDVDLHGVYGKDGRLMNSESIRAEMNKEMGTKNFQHGAHDEWPDRNKEKAGVNRGPQGNNGVTVYGPDGEVYHFDTNEDMKSFYLDHGLDWDSAYGEFEAQVKKINVD